MEAPRVRAEIMESDSYYNFKEYSKNNIIVVTPISEVNDWENIGFPSWTNEFGGNFEVIGVKATYFHRIQVTKTGAAKLRRWIKQQEAK